MRIVIVGDGKVGYYLTQRLTSENHDVVVIDSNPDVLRESLEKFDVMVVNGNGASLQIQKKAGVAESDLLIAATSSDEINMLCCVLARKLGCPHTIARVCNSEYTEQLRFMRTELGLSMTVNPYATAAREIFGLLQFPSFIKRDTFAKGRVELVEIKLSQDSRLVNTRIDRLEDVLHMKVLVCSVERGSEVFIPKGPFVFEAGDNITVTAPRSDLARLIKKLDLSKQKIKSVMIVGAGRIAYFLTEELLKSGVEVKVIEQRMERCNEFAEKFSDAIIICGDGSRQDLLLEEGIEDADAVITLTNIDEENIMISLFAESLKYPKTVTKIDRTEYNHLLSDKGLGSMVCPKQLTADAIIRYVRAMEGSMGGSVLTLHRMVDGKIEALEFIAAAATLYLGRPLKELPLKKDILIACISHEGQVIIPQGNDCISEGDTVVVITPSDKRIGDLNDIFEEML